jgi:hypothetical protein
LRRVFRSASADPDDLRHGNHVLEQTPGDTGAEPPTSDRLRLDQDLVVRDAAPLPEDPGKARDDLLVPARVAVKESDLMTCAVLPRYCGSACVGC